MKDPSGKTPTKGSSHPNPAAQPAEPSQQAQSILEIGGGGEEFPEIDMAVAKQLIGEILDSNSRDNALAELSRCRESIPQLATILWDSFGNE